jgi:hypothetical protein
MSSTLDRYDDRIAGVLSCYDRVVITGTLPTVRYADGMAKFLNANHVRIFDYPEFAEPLRDRVREWAKVLEQRGRLQFYCNGHSRLARRLAAEGIGFTTADNAFTRIADWQLAQDLAYAFSPDQLNRVLDRNAGLCCPVLDVFGQTYHWSLMQVEYATDLVFRSTGRLKPLYELTGSRC